MKRNIALYGITFFILLIMTACGTSEQQVTTETGDEVKETTSVDAIVKQLSTDVVITQTNQIVSFDIKLENQSAEELEFTFPSAQELEIIVQNDSGEEVYRYSSQKSFAQVIQTISLLAGEEKKWHVDWELTDEIPNGNYHVTVHILASHINQKNINTDILNVDKEFEIDRNSDVFRNVRVAGKNGEYVVTGEVKVAEGVFYYAVEDGHDYLVEETEVAVESDRATWGQFEIEISIPTERLPLSGTLTLELYEKNIEENIQQNLYHTVLDQIGY